MTTDSYGNIWFTEEEFDSTVPQSIVRVTPSGKLTHFTAFPPGANEFPDQITPSPGRTLFFTVDTLTLGLPNWQDEIGQISQSGRVSIIHLPSRTAPEGPLIVEPGGNLWFISGYGFSRLTLPRAHRRDG